MYVVRSCLFATTGAATPWPVCDCSIQQATRRTGTATEVDGEIISEYVWEMQPFGGSLEQRGRLW